MFRLKLKFRAKPKEVVVRYSETGKVNWVSRCVSM